ncbi:HNH endonuclease [Paeniglutamicibacter sp. R2-26]|uniref:HNH endonuclease n=1 Tax=Paeniglutamicibacter sp. R2-26 TaxID=3144417 RepID=UPI003EE6E98F
MATAASDGPLSAGNTEGVAGEDLGYEALVARGVDMDELVAEHLIQCGAPGVRGVTEAVNRLPVPADHHSMVASVAALEGLKSALHAKQADLAVGYEDSLAVERLAHKVMVANPGWGASKDVAIAMHLSPKQGTIFTNHSRILIEDLPRTLQGLRDGVLTWAQVRVIASGSRHLQAVNRKMIDNLLWEEAHTCFESGDKKLEEAVAYWALILEPKTEEDLEAKAVKERYLSAYQIDAHRVKFSGILPLECGIPIMQAMARETEHAQMTAGDDRNPGQVGADTFYESMTGLKAGGSIPLELLLVVDPATLIGNGNEPMLIPGFGFVSAGKGRDLIAGDPDDELTTWYRNIYMAPKTGRLVAMDSKARRFTGNLKKLIAVRDQYCRTPYCNGKIQASDHVVQVRKNGKTTAENAAGRCHSCNQTKEAPEWDELPVPGDRHKFMITTPSGHSYISKAPPILGLGAASSSQLQRDLADENPPRE